MAQVLPGGPGRAIHGKQRPNELRECNGGGLVPENGSAQDTDTQRLFRTLSAGRAPDGKWLALIITGHGMNDIWVSRELPLSVHSRPTGAGWHTSPMNPECAGLCPAVPSRRFIGQRTVANLLRWGWKSDVVPNRPAAPISGVFCLPSRGLPWRNGRTGSPHDVVNYTVAGDSRWKERVHERAESRGRYLDSGWFQTATRVNDRRRQDRLRHCSG